MTLLELAKNEKGYVEKSQKYYDELGVNCLYSKRGYGGKDNLTKYAYELNQAKLGHPNGEPWCMTFICWLLWKSFGADIANKLLCGKLTSASTMDVKDAMVKAGRLVPINEAKPLDIVFRSRSGGGHVGLVAGWASGNIVTIEGNSSTTDSNSWNGGEVVEHNNATWMWCCRPDYSIADTWDWIEVNGVWYYQDAYGRNSYGWKKIKERKGNYWHWYYFNNKGQMLTGCQFIDNELCLFMPEGPLEGALCISDTSGYQHPWNIIS